MNVLFFVILTLNKTRNLVKYLFKKIFLKSDF